MSASRRLGATAGAIVVLVAAGALLLAFRGSDREVAIPEPDASPAPDEPSTEPPIVTVPTKTQVPITARPATTQPGGTGRLEGKVVDRAGEPIAGVLVEARASPPPTHDDPPPLTARTDVNGHFVIPDVATGTWTLRADDPRYARARPVTATVPGEGETTPAPPVLVLTSLGWVEGTVHRADGARLRDDLVVLVTGEGDVATAEMVVPVTQGRFRSAGLASRAWTVSVRRPPATASDPEGRDAVVPREVVLVPVVDGVGATADLVLVQGAVFRGRVLDAEQTPIARAEVRAVLGGQPTSGGPKEATTTSGDDGAFSVTGLAGGPWSFTVSAEGFVAQTVKADLQVERTVEREVTLVR